MLLPHLVSINLIKPTLLNSSLGAFLLPTYLRSRFAPRPCSEPISCLHLFHPGLGCPLRAIPPLGAFLEPLCTQLGTLSTYHDEDGLSSLGPPACEPLWRPSAWSRALQTTGHAARRPHDLLYDTAAYTADAHW